MRRRTLLGLAGSAIALPAMGAHAQGNDPLPASAVVGSWQVSIDAGPDRPVVALTTFTAGGNVLSSNPPVRPAPAGADYRLAHVGTGHGTWAVLEGATFAFHFVYFQSDENGRFLGTTTIDARVTLDADGNRFDGDYTVVLADPDGQQIGDGGGTVMATRIDPLSPGTPAATPSS